MKKVYFLLLAFTFGLMYAKAQTVTISPTTLNCGNIEIYNVTDGSHSFDAVIGAASPTQDITIDAYDPSASYVSPSFEVSIDGTNWYTSITFTPSTAGETKTIYVRNSPTVDQADNKSSDIYVYNADYSNYDDIVASTTIIYPEMDMYGNSNAIANGSTTPSTTNYTDFGNVSINSSNALVHTIENSKGGFPPSNRGKLFLKDNGSGYVVISGTDASMFSVTATPSSPINPAGGTSDFTITFTPTSSGLKTATVTIYNNDQDENPYSYSIQGTGVAVAPTVASTTAASSRTASSAQSGGNVSDDGGSTVTARGVCWNTSTGPTISNSHSSDGTGTGTFSSTISGGLGSGTLYYVRAYATNSTGTSYGPEITFYTLSTEPTSQATSLTNTDKSESTLDLSWSSASGADGYIILKRDGATAPNNTGVDDGMKYTSFSSLPSGTTVICETTSTTCQVTGLSATTEYSFAIIPFAKGSDDATYNYKTDGTLATITASTTAAAPTTQASNLKWATASSSSMELTWDNGNGVGRIFVMKANGNVTDPSNGTTYSASSTFGSGDDIGAGSYVVYNGTGGAKSSVIVDNLTSSTTYYLKVLEYNGSGAQTTYNTTSSGTGFANGNNGSTGLPVSLLSFDAEVSGQYVNLNWETASEENNDYFIVERSLDAENFAPIGKVQGAGNSNVMQKYQFTDTDVPSNTVVYYRLHQYDFDGKDEIFPSVSVTLKDLEVGIQSMSMLDNSLIINYSNPNGENTVFQIVDINGKSLQMAVSTASGQQSVNFNLSGLSHGLYFISMEQENKLITRKFVY
jgi:hypothetical protein